VSYEAGQTAPQDHPPRYRLRDRYLDARAGRKDRRSGISSAVGAGHPIPRSGNQGTGRSGKRDVSPLHNKTSYLEALRNARDVALSLEEIRYNASANRIREDLRIAEAEQLRLTAVRERLAAQLADLPESFTENEPIISGKVKQEEIRNLLDRRRQRAQQLHRYQIEESLQQAATTLHIAELEIAAARRALDELFAITQVRARRIITHYARREATYIRALARNREGSIVLASMLDLTSQALPSWLISAHSNDEQVSISERDSSRPTRNDLKYNKSNSKISMWRRWIRFPSRSSVRKGLQEEDLEFNPTPVDEDSFAAWVIEQASGLLPGAVDEMLGHALDNAINTRTDQWISQVNNEFESYRTGLQHLAEIFSTEPTKVEFLAQQITAAEHIRDEAVLARHALATEMKRRVRLELAKRLPDPSSTDALIDDDWLPIRIYLDTDYRSEDVEAAVIEVAQSFGLDLVYDLPPIIASWFKEFFMRLGRSIDSNTTEDRLEELARAVRLKLVYQQQAQVDAAQADAVAKLLGALGDKRENALIQIGSVLLIIVDGVPIVRNLTQRELAYYENNPYLFRDPANTLINLQRAIAADSDETRPQLDNSQ
jgi:hypothetical protein